MCQGPRQKRGRRASYDMHSLLLPFAAAASRSCRWRAAACGCSMLKIEKRNRRVLYDISYLVQKSKIRSAFHQISLVFLKLLFFCLRIIPCYLSSKQRKTGKETWQPKYAAPRLGHEQNQKATYCCCCCSHINESLQRNPWSQDRLHRNTGVEDYLMGKKNTT